MARRVIRNAVGDSKTSKQPKSPAKHSAKSPAKVTPKKQSGHLEAENTNLRRSKRLSQKTLNNVLEKSPAKLTKTKLFSNTKSGPSKTDNDVLQNNSEQMDVDEMSQRNDTCTLPVSSISGIRKITSSSSSNLIDSKNTEIFINDGINSNETKPKNKVDTKNKDLFKMPSIPALKSKSKTKSKKKTDPLTELSKIMDDILTLEAKLSQSDVVIPDISNLTSENIFADFNLLTESNRLEPAIKIVPIDVMNMIAEKLNQTEEFKFSEKFAQFEKYLDESITETTVASIANPLLRLEVMYVRLMVNIISPAPDNDSIFRQEGLQADFLEQVHYYEIQHKASFGVNQLFPAFYFVVRRLVETFQNWEKHCWFPDNQPFNLDNPSTSAESKFSLESPISNMLRRLDDVWCSVLSITQNLLQRSIDKDVFLRINESIAYNTGTVYIFLVLIAKCYQSAIVHNRLEVNFDDQINRRRSWKIVNEFGKMFHQHFENNGYIQELVTLFYPLLIHQQDNQLVLSVNDIVTLTCQLSEMNFEAYNDYQCVYFQMAFSAIHYHFIWEHLKTNKALNFGKKFLTPFTSFDMVTTWESVLTDLSSSYRFPFTIQDINSKWDLIKPEWVMLLLTLLTTIARQSIHSKLVIQKTKSGFFSLRSVFTHFNRILGKNQLTGQAIVASFEQMLK